MVIFKAGYSSRYAAMESAESCSSYINYRNGSRQLDLRGSSNRQDFFISMQNLSNAVLCHEELVSAPSKYETSCKVPQVHARLLRRDSGALMTDCGYCDGKPPPKQCKAINESTKKPKGCFMSLVTHYLRTTYFPRRLHSRLD